MSNENEFFEKLIDDSKKYAESLSAKYMIVEHILATFLNDKKCADLLKKYNINITPILTKIDEYLTNYSSIIHNGLDKIKCEKNTEFFISTFYISNSCNKEFIKNAEDLYLINTIGSFLLLGNTFAQHILMENGVTENLLEKMYNDKVDISFDDRLLKAITNAKSDIQFSDYDTILSSVDNIKQTKKSPIDLYMIDYLGKYLKNYKPMVGREKELELSQQILLRKDKPNLILVGKSGIGKSKIINELSKIIHYTNTKINFFQLDTYALTANIMFKGEIESRLKYLYDSLKDAGETVLFIDNIHNICSTEDNSLQGGISSALKMFMENTYIKIIGTTTPEEYRKYIEKDELFAKKFFKLNIDEPTIDETKKILKSLKKDYEKYYKCKYSSSIINLIIELSDRYLKNKSFPEKSLDIMDMVGAASAYNNETIITEQMVYKTLSTMLNIPLSNISQSEADLYKNLENNLKQEIIGQEEAVKKVSDSIIISRSGLRETNKTAVSLLFTGSSGVGKTELCRVLSKIMGIPLVRFDMSEYMEEHTVSKLLGSPPGYKDSGNGKAGNGLLINAIDENPYCILLLDEIEKAHHKIHNLLLQVMDNGKITSSMGKSVSFDHVFLIMTSNVGSQVSNKKCIGFGNNSGDTPLLEALNDSFLPEFRSRIDATINFNALNETVLSNICIKFLEELKKILLEKHIKFKYTNEVVKYITNKAILINNGARPIKHIITNEIKNVIAKNIVFGKYANGGSIIVNMKDEQLIFEE